MGKPLFKNIKPGNIFQVNKSGKTRKIQDIPKQDFLICTVCEKRMEILETYFAKKLVSINDYNNRKDKFKIIKIGPNEILNCLDIDPLLFKLFYFSIIWRVSVTSNSSFKNFKLPIKIESEIGSFLNDNLFSSHKNLLKNLSLIKSYPKYHLIVYKNKEAKSLFSGILTAFRMSEDHFGIFTSDMILFFYLNDNKIDYLSELISNKEDGKVKFVLTNSNQWKDINLAVIEHRLLNNKYK
ncbi:hypothetical protein [uncultured Maribacter sp.]|uniref:hypothetical protein n=1 Tax=uncultured Maribacter sp. TaxID=431308 RepID=UPI002605C878|nr:hypothetical protein [uncultured Maribacter sp.]